MASKAVIIKVVKPASGSSQAEVRRFSRSSEAAAFTPVSFQEFVSAIRKQFAVPADVQVVCQDHMTSLLLCSMCCMLTCGVPF